MGQRRGERRKKKRYRPLKLFPLTPPPPPPHGFLVGHLSSFRATLLVTFTNHKRKTPGNTPGNACWGCAARFSESWPYFRQKNVIFRTRFRIWPLKSIPVFRPADGHKTQHKHWHKTELCNHLQQKDFLKSISNSHITLSFLFSWNSETTNTLIHHSSSFVNHNRFQTKMSRVYTRFQTKTEQKPYPMGRHIPIWLL